MGYVRFNPNPTNKQVGDCAVRAIAAATGQTWEESYSALALQGYWMGDMPNANSVWGAYLRQRGFTRCVIPSECPDCYTVAEFAEEHPHGVYVLGLSSHVVCVKDGDYLDSWDSGAEIPLLYWQKEGK